MDYRKEGAAFLPDLKKSGYPAAILMEVINFEKATKNVRCRYCQIDENSQCHVDGFEDPEGDVRLTICVGGGEMILELTIGDKKDIILVEDAHFCPYCGRRIN